MGIAVDPGESRLAALGTGPNICLDRCRLKPVERTDQPLIGAAAGPPANALEQIAWLQPDNGRQIVSPTFAQLVEVGREIDHDVCVPDRRHAIGRVGGDMDADRLIGTGILYRLYAFALRQAEEGPLHRFLIITQRNITEIGQGEEHFELDLALLKRRL